MNYLLGGVGKEYVGNPVDRELGKKTKCFDY